jgi:hypothetical protein
MNENPTNDGAVAPSRWAGLTLWLASQPRGWWATARGRWCQTFLTAGLVVASVTAWALAIVQPWTGRPAEYGAVAFAEGLDTGKIRAASGSVERLFPERTLGPRLPARNPFAARPAQATAAQDAARPQNRRPDAATDAPQGRAPDVKTILETVKTLRLEVTLTTPTGERWAVINGENLREGDTIAGLEITEIQDGKVKLRHGGTSCLLRMD